MDSAEPDYRSNNTLQLLKTPGVENKTRIIKKMLEHLTPVINVEQISVEKCPKERSDLDLGQWETRAEPLELHERRYEEQRETGASGNQTSTAAQLNRNS